MGRHTDTPEAADDPWTENRGDPRPDEMFASVDMDALPAAALPSVPTEEADRASAYRLTRERLLPQTACACGGLTYPAMPHLHAEDCPIRGEAVSLFRETPEERRGFDQFTETYGGSPLRQIAIALDTWGRMNRGGSYSAQCFIMANECLIADAAINAPPSADTPTARPEEAK